MRCRYTGDLRRQSGLKFERCPNTLKDEAECLSPGYQECTVSWQSHFLASPKQTAEQLQLCFPARVTREQEQPLAPHGVSRPMSALCHLPVIGREEYWHSTGFSFTSFYPVPCPSPWDVSTFRVGLFSSVKPPWNVLKDTVFPLHHPEVDQVDCED